MNTAARNVQAVGPPGDKEDDLVRLQIMQAAEWCFGRHGVAKTTMDDVARAVRLSRPALYRYFSNRDDLVNAVLVRGMRNFNARAHAAIHPRSSFTDAVVTAMTMVINGAVTEPYIRATLNPDVVGVTTGLVQGQAFQDAAEELWDALIERGVVSGEVRADMDVHAASRWLIDVEFLLANRIMQGTLALDQVEPIVREFALPGLLTQPRSEPDASSGPKSA